MKKSTLRLFITSFTCFIIEHFKTVHSKRSMLEIILTINENFHFCYNGKLCRCSLPSGIYPFRRVAIMTLFAATPNNSQTELSDSGTMRLFFCVVFFPHDFLKYYVLYQGVSALISHYVI